MIDFRMIHLDPPPPVRALMGLGDAGTILSQEAGDTSGYFDSPAFLEGQAATLQNECDVDPSAPDCLVAESTGDITMGYNPVADTVLNLNNYCQQNVQNNITFGTALDTGSCSGSTPLPAVIAQASSNAAGFVPLTPTQISNEANITPGTVAAQITPATTTPVTTPATTTTPVASAPAAGSGGSTGATSDDGFALPAWLTEDSIAGIQNWILLAGGLVALMILPSMLSRSR